MTSLIKCLNTTLKSRMKTFQDVYCFKYENPMIFWSSQIKIPSHLDILINL